MSKDLKYLKWAQCGAKLFSTCDSRQYMSIITDQEGYVVGIGYNGSPKGMRHCDQGACPHLANKGKPRSNYDTCIAIHAEANALLHSEYTARRNGGTMYINGLPCFSCAKLIANSGIKKIVYIHEQIEFPQWPEIKVFLFDSGVEVQGYTEDELSWLPGW